MPGSALSKEITQIGLFKFPMLATRGKMKEKENVNQFPKKKKFLISSKYNE